MMGLILKDYYNVIKYFKAYIILIVVFLGVASFDSSNYFYVLYPAMVAGIIPAILMTYDEKEHWDVFCATLPYSRADVVTVKYLEAAAMTFGLVLFSIVNRLIRAIVTGAPINQEIFGLVLPLVIAALAQVMINMPISFYFGATKGRIVPLVCIGGVCGMAAGISTFEKNDLTGLGSISQISVWIALLVLLLLYVLSWRLSIKLYEKRDL